MSNLLIDHQGLESNLGIFFNSLCEQINKSSEQTHKIKVFYDIQEAYNKIGCQLVFVYNIYYRMFFWKYINIFLNFNLIWTQMLKQNIKFSSFVIPL